MKSHAPRFAILLRPFFLIAPLLLVAGCGPSNQQRTARLLDYRLQTHLSAAIATNRAALRPLPDGAQVTLLSSSLFPNDTDALDDRENDIRASVVEGLLDPYLMRVQVADTSALPEDQRDERVSNVVKYFAQNGLASVLRQAEPRLVVSPEPVAATPGGLTITISVYCPHRHDGAGYGSGKKKPACF